ncbi:VTT domain-containing protein [Leptolyngbya sp. 7M]|uniref:VTT domain-containing protein n=1 Tax=Leptolyngbya sp. 7M TaxID=2812896 RepID=UPI001CED2065|nr:VTT domain-containing protein [Leptolyngbya sp. 7M]
MDCLWLGLLLLISAVVVAAVISFFIHKRISGRRLPNAASRYIKVDAVYQALMKEDYWRTTFIIFLLRVSVIMPFAFTNFLLASARVRLSSYVIGTFTGMLPRSAAMAFAGAGLSQLDPQSSRDMVALFIGLAATIGVIVLIARFSRVALKRMTNGESEAEAAICTES